MREIRKSGSEGGGADTRLSLPLSNAARHAVAYFPANRPNPNFAYKL